MRNAGFFSWRRFPRLNLKLSGMEGLTPVGLQSAVRSRRSLRRGSSRSAHGKQSRSGTQRLKGVSTLNEIEFRTPETRSGIRLTRKGWRAPSRASRISSEFLEWRSPHLTEIELRLLEIPQEAIAAHEAKSASRSTLSSRTISEQSASHLTISFHNMTSVEEMWIWVE